MKTKKKIIRASTIPLSLDIFCKGLLQELSEEYEVVALSSPGELLDKVERREGVRAIRIPMERHISLRKDIVALWRLIKVFRKEKPYIVHSITPKAGLLCMIAAWVARVPIRIHTFTGLIFPYVKGLMQKVLMLTDAITGTSIIQEKYITVSVHRKNVSEARTFFRRIETLPIPVIAAVNGFALGGGCELAMSCDFRICSDNAVFGQPEVGLGITPGFGGTQRLARLIGPGYAKQMIYTARNIKADEALRVGLVNQVVPQEELMPTAEKLASGIAKNAPIAVRQCKKAINEGLELKMDDAIVLEEKLFGDCFETHDQVEGMTAFMEKRKEKNFTNN